MAVDFTSAYSSSTEAMVCMMADLGTGVAESSGFVANVAGTNYIITAAHAVLVDRTMWEMPNMLFTADAKNCGAWKGSGSIPLPANVRNITFRYIGKEDALTKSVSLDNVVVEDSTGVLFKDDFSGPDGLTQFWKNDPLVPWTIEKGKGKMFQAAAKSGAMTLGGNDISSLTLEIGTAEVSTLKFDYKVDCEGGKFLVGYCSEARCGRVSDEIYGYWGQKMYRLKVVALDGKGDIAMCLPLDKGVSLAGIKGMVIRPSNLAVPIASQVAVVGNPLGIDSRSIATGVLRDNNYVLPSSQVVESVLTSIADFPGNSGSPYILLDGTVVGLNTYGLASDQGGESTLNGGPGATLLNRVVTSLAPKVKEGIVVEYEKGYLGLQLVGADMNVINQLDLPMKGANPASLPGGMVVLVVEDDSPIKDKVKKLDVIISLQRSEEPTTKRMLGIFPGQSNPSEVTWFMPPDGAVDITVLRFDMVKGVWEQLTLPNLKLKNYPPSKDVPLGPTLSWTTKAKKGGGGPIAFARVAQRGRDGKVVSSLYSLSKAI